MKNIPLSSTHHFGGYYTIQHVDKIMRIFFFSSFYSYKWNNNRSSYSLRYLKARMLWECRYRAKSHTASHAAFISVAVLSISPQHSARGLHDFFPFPGRDFDTVTHYCCQIINTSETVPEKEKKKKLNPMQALHVGSSVLQWLSCKKKARSHLDAPTGISCLTTLALLDTLHTAWVHPIAHTPDLRLSSESPHIFLPSPCQGHEPRTPPGQPPLYRPGSHYLQKFKCNSTKDNLKLVPLFCFSLHNNDKKDQCSCQYWNFYMLLLWKFQEAICLVTNPCHRLPVSNWYLKRKENQAFNLGRSHLSLYQVRELGCRLRPDRGSPKAEMPPASHPQGALGSPSGHHRGERNPAPCLGKESEASHFNPVLSFTHTQAHNICFLHFCYEKCFTRFVFTTSVLPTTSVLVPSREEWSEFVTKQRFVTPKGTGKTNHGGTCCHLSSPNPCSPPEMISLVEQQQAAILTWAPIAGLCHRVSAEPISSIKAQFISAGPLVFVRSINFSLPFGFLFCTENFLKDERKWACTFGSHCPGSCGHQGLGAEPTWATSTPSFPYRDTPANLSVMQLFWRMSYRWLSLHQLLMLSNQRRCCDSYRFSHMTSHSLREDKQTSCMFCNICFRGFSGKMFEAVSKLDWCIVWTFSQNNQDVQGLLHLLYKRGCTHLPRGAAPAAELGIFSL